MRDIVETYKREIQIFLNKEDEEATEEVLTSVGPELQETFVLQRGRLRKEGLNLLWQEEAINGGRHEGAYIRTWVEDKRKYISQNGKSSNVYRIMKKAYCIMRGADTKKKVAFVEVKNLSLKSCIKKLKKWWKFYFGDTEHIKEVLTSGEYVLTGVIIMLAMMFSCVGMSYFFHNQQYGDFILGWPIFFMWVVVGVVFIIRSNPEMDRDTSDTTILCVQQKKYDFSPETFIAMATARLKCMYYAESPDELAHFISFNIRNFLFQHRDVVNCEQTRFVFEEFSTTTDYMYMTVQQQVLLDIYRQGRIEQQEETVTVWFMKARNSIMSEDFYEDWYVTGVEVVKEPEYE